MYLYYFDLQFITMSTATNIKSESDSTEKLKIPFLTTKYDIREKYEKKKGKSLFLRFPKKLPIEQNVLENLVKTLCNKIIRVRRLRQKSTRCCLVDFNTKEERDESFKHLKKVEINERRLVVQIPRTENEKFLEKLIEKSELNREQKRVREKLKKEAKKAKKIRTSSIIIHNISHNVPLSEIQALFPNAIEMLRTQSKSNESKDIVNIKFPTIEDAREAVQKKMVLNGQPLFIKYDMYKSKKLKQQQKHEKSSETSECSKITPKKIVSQNKLRFEKKDRRKKEN